MKDPLFRSRKGWPVRWKSEEPDCGEWIYRTAEKLNGSRKDTRLIESLWDIRFDRVMELLRDDREEAMLYTSEYNSQVASNKNKVLPRGGRHWENKNKKENLVL